MAKNCDHSFLTQHLGTEQGNRSRNKLVPENLQLNEFTVEDWMKFAYNFAEKLNYFDTSDHQNASGDWTEFLVEKEEISAFLENNDGHGTMKPHLTLFVCFLKLLTFTQRNFNGITKRHLDFYFTEILQLEKKAPVADHVHLIFELAKNSQQALIKQNTIALADKDLLGTNRNYSTNTEAVINKAQVAALKSVYHHRTSTAAKSNEYNSIVAASVVNSADGISDAFTKNEPWRPFGYPSFIKDNPKLPTAKLGFAIAAPILMLQEGNRDITVTIALEKSIAAMATSSLTKDFDIYATGPEGWIGPLEPTKSKTTESSDKELKFSLYIDAEMPAIVGFDPAIHEDTFTDGVPMLTFQLKIAQPEHASGYALYTRLLDNPLLSIDISVHVTDIASVHLANDIGPLKADKPLYPFGTQPVKKGAFYIDYPEVFSKKWESVTVKGDWLDAPDNFVEHYIAYRKKRKQQKPVSQSVLSGTLFS